MSCACTPVTTITTIAAIASSRRIVDCSVRPGGFAARGSQFSARDSRTAVFESPADGVHSFGTLSACGSTRPWSRRPALTSITAPRGSRTAHRGSRSLPRAARIADRGSRIAPRGSLISLAHSSGRPLEQLHPRAVRPPGRAGHADLAGAAARVVAVGGDGADFGGRDAGRRFGQLRDEEPAVAGEAAAARRRRHEDLIAAGRGDGGEVRRVAHLHQRADRVQHDRGRPGAASGERRQHAGARRSRRRRRCASAPAVRGCSSLESVARGSGHRRTGSCRRPRAGCPRAMPATGSSMVGVGGNRLRLAIALGAEGHAAAALLDARGNVQPHAGPRGDRDHRRRHRRLRRLPGSAPIVRLTQDGNRMAAAPAASVSRQGAGAAAAGRRPSAGSTSAPQAATQRRQPRGAQRRP